MAKKKKLNMIIKPKTKLGKLSVGLNIFFLIVIGISITLVSLGILSFDDIWWDISVNVFILPIVALFTGIRAVRKYRDHSFLVYVSISISICAILFLLLHSLFIND